MSVPVSFESALEEAFARTGWKLLGMGRDAMGDLHIRARFSAQLMAVMQGPAQCRDVFRRALAPEAPKFSPPRMLGPYRWRTR